MPTLRAQLFGSGSFSLGKKSVKLRDRISRAMLAFLLLQPSHTASRSLLIETFFPDVPEEAARNRLSVYLNRLRKALPGLLDTTREVVSLVPNMKAQLDVVEFEARIVQAGKCEYKDPKCKETFEKAIALYRCGEFLVGCENEWCLKERALLRERHRDALQGITRSCHSRKEYGEAFDF